MKHLPQRHSDSTDRIVLSVSPHEEDHAALKGILSPAIGTIQEAANAASARDVLMRAEVGVVLCEKDLNPGSWIDMLDIMIRLPEPPPLIVTSRLADESLWAEALNLGAYDVLAKPFDRMEVLRTVDLACLRARPRPKVRAAGR